MNLYLRILKFIRPYWTPHCSRFLYGHDGRCQPYVPWIVRDVIDKVFQNKDSDLLNLISLGIVVIFFARGIFYYGQSYLMNYVGESIVIDVRGIVYRKLMTLSTHFFDTNKLGTIMSYVTNDVAALQGAMVANSIESSRKRVSLSGASAPWSTLTGS